MWQRFTERARRVVFYAQEEAQRLGENYVSTEHLLLGVVRDDDNVAARILSKMGVTTTQIRAELENRVQPGGTATPGRDMQLTPRGKRIIDLAYDEARQFGNNYIGTEHLLLGLIREGEGMAGLVLANVGVELAAARKQVQLLQDANPINKSAEARTGTQGMDGGSAAPAQPYSAAARAALGVARTEAEAKGNPEVGTAHLLLALLQSPDSLAGSILADAGITIEQVRQRISRTNGE